MTDALTHTVVFNPASNCQNRNFSQEERYSSREDKMSIAKVTEIIASSNSSFEDALQKGIERANKTLKNVKGAWVKGHKVVVDGGKIVEYRVTLKVSFVLTD
jgi:flavin-binding protein dodecin